MAERKPEGEEGPLRTPDEVGGEERPAGEPAPAKPELPTLGEGMASMQKDGFDLKNCSLTVTFPDGRKVVRHIGRGGKPKPEADAKARELPPEPPQPAN